MYTTEIAQQYIDEHAQEILQSFQECEEVIPDYMKGSDFFMRIWEAGCWLNHTLEEHGASEEENKAIGFAHGQRCFGRDPLQEAVRLVNEFIETGTTQDRPGFELAEKICREVLDI